MDGDLGARAGQFCTTWTLRPSRAIKLPSLPHLNSLMSSCRPAFWYEDVRLCFSPYMKRKRGTGLKNH